MASQDIPEVEDAQTATVQALAQSSTTFRATPGNSSARRSGPLSSHENRPHSSADSEDIRLHSLHQRPSRRNTSRSRQNIEHAIGTGSIGSTDRQDSDPITNANGRSPPGGSQGIDHFPGRTVAEDARSARSISIRSERTYLQRRDLGIIDVAALIINKQIGTGIFTTPGLVLSLTGSKTTSIIMWFCGGIWAFLCVVIYVEFGSAFPFNGGELIYLDEVLRRPELLATVLFSAFFIFVPNTDGNSLQFARHILLASNPTVTETTELDKRLISYVAVSILTVVSFIHYFSRNSGLLLNLVFATYKVVLVTVLIICGIIASKKSDNGRSDWGEQPVASKDVLGAMIYIIYSYQGWENANYVGGELKIESRALKWGAFLAVGVTTILYTLVVMAFSLACPFQELEGQDLGVVSNFAPKAFGKQGVEGIKICIALSAFGNLIAVVYTSSKVKQQIARQCIIPFYNFFARDDKQFMTPAGALILHWVMAVVWILATPNTSSGYGFIIGLFIYGQLVVGAQTLLLTLIAVQVFVGVAFFFIRRNYEMNTTRSNNLMGGSLTWYPVILKNKYLRAICGITFIGMNLMVLIQSARATGSPPAWLRPVIIGSLLALASIYWSAIRIVENRSNSESPLEIRIEKDGMPIRNEEDRPLLLKAKLEGNSRIVVYQVHGKLKAILNFVAVTLHQIVKLAAR